MLPFFVYELIFEKCFLGNSILLDSEMKAGYIISTGHLIYYLSTDVDKEKILFDIAGARLKNPIDSIYEHLRAVILMAFHSYKLSDLKQLTRNELIELFVVAENALTKREPNFIRLDLEKLFNGDSEEESEKPKKKEGSKKKRFVAENAELERILGDTMIEEAEELAQQERTLSIDELRKLDSMRR
tara:strand:- start:195 stop:752 length:558 start_codon:yes stop_codon:yes gene_type:complete